MTRSVYNLARRNSLALIFGLIVFAALVGAVLSVPSGRANGQAPNGAEPSAPTVTQLCFTNQNLGAPDPAPITRAGGIVTDSTGCSLASSGCVVTAGVAFFSDVYAINATGCGAGQNPSITARTCTTIMCPMLGPAAADTLVAIYQKNGGAPGSFGDPVFDPNNPCVNLRALDNNGCSPQSTQTVTLCPGVFVVVVTHNVQGVGGTYNLEILVNPGTSCQITQIPTAIELDAFTANGYVDGTNINWKTGREVDNLGFNIYREEGGTRTRVNDQMLAGSALLAGSGTDLRAGNSYSWTDSLPATKRSRYWLEDLGLDGQSTWHGPFNVKRAAPGELLPPSSRGRRAQLLSKLGADGTPGGQTVPVPPVPSLPEMSAMASRAQPGFAMGPAMKLSIKQEGWYRVTGSELAAAGFDTKTDPRLLQMFVDGQEQSISVVGEQDGRFDPSDGIEFYGIGLESGYTDSRVYWLTAGSQPGLRIEKVKGKGSRTSPASFPYTVERRDRTIYFSALRNGEKENFFGPVIARDAVSQAINVQHLDSASSAELEIALQGVTQLPHRVKIELNGVEVGYTGFDGQSEGITRIPIGRGGLKEGQNIVRLTAIGGESDISLLKYIRVTYSHTYTADNDALRFIAARKEQVTIDGFTNPAIRVIDVTEPGAVREVSARVQSRNGSYSVTVSAPKNAGDRLLWAFAEGRASAPPELALNRASNLREPGQGAELVILTHRDFLDIVNPLKAARESQGLSVALVDVEDVYDEFSFGHKSPQAVKDFLAFAKTSWQRAPRFVLLVGDASLDPKGHFGFEDSDFVPTKLIDTSLMETASDDWLADFNGDGVADMAIGRLPVRTAEEAVSMVSKIIAYDASEPSNRVLLVADGDDEFNFESLSRDLRSAIPQNLMVSEIDRGRTDPALAQSLLLAGFLQGQRIVNYVGHGSVDVWRGNLLTSATARGLDNSAHLPFVVSMTCLNGYFQDATTESLAESLIKAERGGAVAVWASSGMTGPAGQAVINRRILKLLLDESSRGSLTLGEAIVSAKSAVNDSDVRRTWILFGDPTTRLR